MDAFFMDADGREYCNRCPPREPARWKKDIRAILIKATLLLKKAAGLIRVKWIPTTSFCSH